MKLKKYIILFLIVCLSLTLFTACKEKLEFKSSFYVIFNVNTGDNVKVKLNTSDGLKLTADLPFKVKDGDKVLLQGKFITIEGFELYKNRIENEKNNVTVYEQTTKDNLSYIFYTTETDSGTEYNYIIKINNSNTGIILGCLESKEVAENVFNHLTFTIEK